MRQPGWHAGGSSLSLDFFSPAMLLGRSFQAPSWVVWAAGVAVTVPVVAALALLAGPTIAMRRMLIARIRTMIAGLKPKRA